MQTLHILGRVLNHHPPGRLLIKSITSIAIKLPVSSILLSLTLKRDEEIVLFFFGLIEILSIGVNHHWLIELEFFVSHSTKHVVLFELRGVGVEVDHLLRAITHATIFSLSIEFKLVAAQYLDAGDISFLFEL